jgi:HNH endonuclease
VSNNNQYILALDVGGRPYEWLLWQEAVTLYARDEIAWEAGDTKIIVRGGISHKTGVQSEIHLNSIVAVRGANIANKKRVPSLTNRALFVRDGHVCMYCGEQFQTSLLTRDHIMPKAQGGADKWDNVITACKHCNNKKGNRTPHAAGMPLLAIPYVPNRAEYLLLKNRNILVDQMLFLKHHVPRCRAA